MSFKNGSQKLDLSASLKPGADFFVCLLVREKTEKTTCFGSILVEGALARVEQDPKKNSRLTKPRAH